jgi:hypothetical protein
VAALRLKLGLQLPLGFLPVAMRSQHSAVGNTGGQTKLAGMVQHSFCLPA